MLCMIWPFRGNVFLVGGVGGKCGAVERLCEEAVREGRGGGGGGMLGAVTLVGGGGAALVVDMARLGVEPALEIWCLGGEGGLATGGLRGTLPRVLCCTLSFSRSWDWCNEVNGEAKVGDERTSLMLCALDTMLLLGVRFTDFFEGGDGFRGTVDNGGGGGFGARLGLPNPRGDSAPLLPLSDELVTCWN